MLSLFNVSLLYLLGILKIIGHVGPCTLCCLGDWDLSSFHWLVDMDIFNFSLICERLPISICPALGINDSKCFARNVGIGSWLIFQPGKNIF